MDDMPEAFREWVIDFGDSGYVARYPTDSKDVMILAVRASERSGLLKPV